MEDGKYEYIPHWYLIPWHFQRGLILQEFAIRESQNDYEFQHRYFYMLIILLVFSILFRYSHSPQLNSKDL